MKRVTIDPVTRIVLNVEVVDETTPIGIRVADETFVGPTMLWNGDRDAPEFAAAAVEEEPAPEA